MPKAHGPSKNIAPATTRHRDEELNEPQHLSNDRLFDIVRECLLDWQAYPSLPGGLRRSRNGITALMEIRRRIDQEYGRV